MTFRPRNNSDLGIIITFLLALAAFTAFVQHTVIVTY